MTAKIVVVGSFNTDLTAYVHRLPKPGETLLGTRFMTGPGGKGSNQAVAAARLGTQVTFVGRIGHDDFGGFGLRLWQGEGINTDYVVWDKVHSTGVAPIWVDEQGENSIIVIPGANLAVSRQDVDATLDEIAQADILITQLEIPLETAHHALKVAKRHGVRTVLNPAPAEKLPPDMIALADYITPNQSELAAIVGDNFNSSDLEASARSLLYSDQQSVIITLGSQGAKWVSKTQSGHIPAYPVKVVDTTGAGDAFNAGLAVALAENAELEDAIRFANAAAALSATRPGTAASMPNREEVDSLVNGTARA